MKNPNIVLIASLLILPNFALPARPRLAPPEAGAVTATQRDEKPHAPGDNYPSNVGAVNEGGGSANTNGMNEGLSPNASGSGTLNSRAGDTSGFSFGKGATEDQDKGAVNPAQER